ncbi:Nedd8-activating enzyme E1 catalytic subunit [Halotydeus destructor]|nr:Nedd8-activating enzyme E1 catalytic subunit [Halotydeus destructor]
MEIANRWNHVKKILERTGPLSAAGFEPCPELFDFIQNDLRILVVGAGGLGCELLKNLALMGFRNIDVIDMDTIDLSNLNRQFLFRTQDIGKSKAEVAARFINNRVSGAKITPHFKKIQDMDDEFYKGFRIVVCGLDSIVARRWINGMLVSLLEYEDGVLDENSIIPMVDGGTEGFKGNARVILPGRSACVECTLDLFPPQVNFPLCTIAHTPRLPEHCIEYAKVLLWPKEEPFGQGVPIDGDDPSHVTWLHEKALERAATYHIEGVTYRLTQGVIKNIIPAVASTNAIVASVCATEVFKVATSCFTPMNNYMVFNDSHGIYSYTYEAERKENCLVCSQVPQTLTFGSSSKLADIIDHLVNSNEFQMKNPGITTTFKDGHNRTLYIQTVPSIEERTRPNLKKTLEELHLCDGQQIVVADVTNPSSIVFVLKMS